VPTAIGVARAANCEWIHADYEPHLAPFYATCGSGKTWGQSTLFARARHECEKVYSDPGFAQNGLLLRSDLLRLFDARMLSIDLRTLRVSLCKSLQVLDEYKQLKGKRIAGPKQSKLRPSVIALQDHWKHFTSNV
jgi:hypothetical protein